MKPPVFIVGCPRSGTTLLYSMLLAAGGFTVYRKETYYYHLAPFFPRRRTVRARRRFERRFLAGYLGKVPGVPVDGYMRDALAASRTYEEFLPLFMNALTSAQRMDRWMEATPTHVLYMHDIKRAVPNAQFVHVIRDGRDCALSYDKQGWTSTLPWDRTCRVGISALYWDYTVRTGRASGRRYPRDYVEVRFEQLIDNPRAALNELGAFLGHHLDYDRILQNPVHSLKRPNTSFGESRGCDFNPVGRWKARQAAADARLCELLVGSRLDELGYPRAYSEPDARLPLRVQVLRTLYPGYFSTKYHLRVHTPLGRVLTSTRIWAEQPRAGEATIYPTRNVAPALTSDDRGMASV
jgi:hypothetical protein